MMPYRKQAEVEVTDDAPQLYPFNVYRCVFCGSARIMVQSSCAAHADCREGCAAAHVHVSCVQCDGRWLTETYATHAAQTSRWLPLRVAVMAAALVAFTGLIMWLWTGWPWN